MLKIPRKESEQVEFKTSFDLELVESLCAFANSKGGTVYLGVDDKGTVHGLQDGPESLRQWLNQIKTSTTPALLPDVEFVEANGRTIAMFLMPEFPIKPAACKGRYFKRIGNSNHQLSASEVADMHLRTFNTSWDAYPDQQHSLVQISLAKVGRFIKRVNENRENRLKDTPMNVLKKFELVLDGRPTHAAFLLFMKDESALSTIELGHFQTETLIKDSSRLKADLFTEVNSVLDFIKKHINKRVIITGKPQHDEIWDYPIDALREIILNAVIHRDYSQSADTVIKIFDNRIEFYNPGKLPSGLTIKKLISGVYVSRPRNKKIAEAFKEAGLIEKYGSGIRRILSAVKEAGCQEPLFEEIADGLRVTVFALPPQDTPPATPPVTPPVRLQGLLAEKIITLVKQNSRISRSEMARELNIGIDTVKEYIAKLRKQGRLMHEGRTSAGEWVVKEAKK